MAQFCRKPRGRIYSITKFKNLEACLVVRTPVERQFAKMWVKGGHGIQGSLSRCYRTTWSGLIHETSWYFRNIYMSRVHGPVHHEIADFLFFARVPDFRVLSTWLIFHEVQPGVVVGERHEQVNTLRELKSSQSRHRSCENTRFHPI